MNDDSNPLPLWWTELLQRFSAEFGIFLELCCRLPQVPWERFCRAPVANWKRGALLILSLLLLLSGISQADPLDNWTRRNPLPRGDLLYDVAYGNGTFVTVGWRGYVLTSSDGLSWTPRNSGFTDNFNAVTYASGKFVAVSDSGKVLTSADGVNWTMRASGQGFLTGVTYGNGLYVVVGFSGKILTSSDGITWTTRASGITQPLQDVTFGSGIFVAVGGSGTILRSGDGITWNIATSGTTNQLLYVAYGSGLFVIADNSSTIRTSPDGVAWTSRATGGGKGATRFLNGIFVACAQSSAIYTSADGITWTQRFSSNSVGYLYGLGYGGGKFIVVGDGANITSSDGMSWTSQNTDVTQSMHGVAYGSGKLVAVGFGGAILTSTDGASWTKRTGPGYGSIGVTYGSSKFVAVGGSGAIATSSDGITWAAQTSGTTQQLQGVAAGNGAFVAVGLNGTIVSSPDGSAWTTRTSGTSNALYGACYGNGLFVAVGNYGTVLTSPNGVTWNTRTVPASLLLRAVVYANAKFVAVGFSPGVATSTDGVTWTVGNTGNPNSLWGITYREGTYVAVGFPPYISTSTDGVAWTNRDYGSNSILYGVCTANGTLVAVGSGGTILTAATPTVTSISPSPVLGSNARQTFTINGANFDPNCTVTLRNLTTGLVYPNRPIVSLTASSIVLNPNFTANAANWTVQVINPTGPPSGEFPFTVTAPASVPKITSIGPATIAAQSGPQTVALAGVGFAPGSVVRLRCLETGAPPIDVAATFIDSLHLTFAHVFSTIGKWSLTVVRPDGQESQPKVFTVSRNPSEFRLSFPLMGSAPNGGTTPWTAGVSSLFDHRMKVAWEPGLTAPPTDPSKPDTYGFVTFAGDECTMKRPIPTGGEPYNDRNGGKTLYGYKRQDGQSLLVNVAYGGGLYADYDSHYGIDYPGIDGTTLVYAAGSGTVIEKNEIVKDGRGIWVQIEHIDDNGLKNSYSTEYLHLHHIDGGVKKGRKIFEGQLIGATGGTGDVGPHLHFTVRRGDKHTCVDPYGFIPSADVPTDPYEQSQLAGVKNYLLWRDDPVHPIRVFPIFFAVPPQGSDYPVSIDVGLESYTATVTEGASWLTIVVGGSGAGQATLGFSVALNPGGEREGRIKIMPSAGGERVLTIVQEKSPIAGTAPFAAVGGNAPAGINVAAASPGQNPTTEELVAEIRVDGSKYQIPSGILAAVSQVESQWRQFDASGNPLVGPTGGIGLMQIDTQNPAVPMDVARVGADWRYNIEIGCEILLVGWQKRLGDTLSPYDDENDADPAILENWFHAVAWYRGEGAAAYAFAGAVWDVVKNPAAAVAGYFAAVPNLGDPRVLGGFPNVIPAALPPPGYSLALTEPATLLNAGMYSLSLLRLSDATIHRWSWSAVAGPGGIEAPIDITDSIRTDPVTWDFDTWAARLGEYESGPLADMDGDGDLNLAEFAFGGDPGDPASAPSLIVTRNGNQIQAAMTVPKAALGITVGLQTSANLADWNTTAVTPVVTLENQTAKTIQWTFSNTGSPLFLRVLVSKDNE